MDEIRKIISETRADIGELGKHETKNSQDVLAINAAITQRLAMGTFEIVVGIAHEIEQIKADLYPGAL